MATKPTPQKPVRNGNDYIQRMVTPAGMTPARPAPSTATKHGTPLPSRPAK